MMEKNIYFKRLFLKILSEQDASFKVVKELIKGGDEIDLSFLEQDNLLHFKLEGRNGYYFKKVREALKRIEDDTFGICQECGEEIENARLLARPMTDLCIKCKEDEESNEKHIPYIKKSHTTGKGFVGDNLANIKNHQDEDNVENGMRIVRGFN